MCPRESFSYLLCDVHGVMRCPGQRLTINLLRTQYNIYSQPFFAIPPVRRGLSIGVRDTLLPLAPPRARPPLAATHRLTISLIALSITRTGAGVTSVIVTV